LPAYFVGKGGPIMAMIDDTLDDRDEDLEELLVEAEDPGPGDWLEDMDAIGGE
jgi:hypothetical protein